MFDCLDCRLGSWILFYILIHYILGKKKKTGKVYKIYLANFFLPFYMSTFVTQAGDSANTWTLNDLY